MSTQNLCSTLFYVQFTYTNYYWGPSGFYTNQVFFHIIIKIDLINLPFRVIKTKLTICQKARLQSILGMPNLEHSYQI